jgi:transporter family-2 protein
LKLAIITGVLVALLTGLAIGVQSTITSRAGSFLGDIKTGLLTNFIGGAIAGSIILVVILKESTHSWNVSRGIVGLVAVSGLLGIFIITGISFSLQRAGIAAGLAGVFLGQMILSLIVDTLGVGGVEPIPMSSQRLAGLIIVGAGVFLLLPRS